MKITRELSDMTAQELRGMVWSGAAETLEELTDAEVDTLIIELDFEYNEMTETELNDLLWFERDYIAELLGYKDFDEIIER